MFCKYPTQYITCIFNDELSLQSDMNVHVGLHVQVGLHIYVGLHVHCHIVQVPARSWLQSIFTTVISKHMGSV